MILTMVKKEIDEPLYAGKPDFARPPVKWELTQEIIEKRWDNYKLGLFRAGKEANLEKEAKELLKMQEEYSRRGCPESLYYNFGQKRDLGFEVDDNNKWNLGQDPKFEDLMEKVDVFLEREIEPIPETKWHPAEKRTEYYFRDKQNAGRYGYVLKFENESSGKIRIVNLHETDVYGILSGLLEKYKPGPYSAMDDPREIRPVTELMEIWDEDQESMYEEYLKVCSQIPTGRNNHRLKPKSKEEYANMQEHFLHYTQLAYISGVLGYYGDRAESWKHFEHWLFYEYEDNYAHEQAHAVFQSIDRIHAYT